MARKKKDNDLDSGIPENEEFPEDENEEIEEDEEAEDMGVDEMFGSSNPGSAHRDLDGWGSDEEEG